jgi:RNA polymerase sigma-70 factor (ECF subfamily)
VSREPSDADLLALAAAGDRAAFEVLYRRHAAWLVLRLRHRCSDHTVVDDVVQDTFLDVWRGAAKYHADGDVPGWLWRIGSRRLVDALRKTGRQGRLGRVLSRLRGADEPAPAAEEQVLAGIEHGDLAGALAKLSPELRAVLQATVIDGLSTAEAAVLLGIPAGTVKTRAMRARRQLRQELA